MSRFQKNSLSGPLHDVAANAGHPGPDSADAKPRMGVSGVRSSWETRATKSERRRSSSR